MSPQNLELLTQDDIDHADLITGYDELTRNHHNDGALAAFLTQPPLTHSHYQDPPFVRSLPPPSAHNNRSAAALQAN